MNMQTIDVTPKMAKNWLDNNNKQNRRIYDGRVENYARDMRKGLWKENNQGIGFDKDNNLIDGQHRLAAIVASGTSQKIIVVRGLDHDAQATIDQGKPRGAGDVLQLMVGMENANTKVAIARVIMSAISKTVWGAYSPLLILKVIELYSKEIEMVLKNSVSNPQFKKSPILTAIVLAAKCFPKEAIDFAHGYFIGDNLEVGNPCFALRNYVINNKFCSRGRQDREKTLEITMLCLKHFILNSKIKTLKHTAEPLDYFLSKQARTVNQVLEIIS